MMDVVQSPPASSSTSPGAPSAPPPPPPDDKPLIAINWSEMDVTAKLVTNAAPAGILVERFAVYPKLDDRLPHRRMIKPLSMKNKFRMQQQQKNHVTVAGSPLKGPPAGLPPAVKNVSKAPGSGPTVARRMSNGSGNGEKVKRCHICGKGFNKSTYLKRHIQAHSSVKPYKCDICGWGMYIRPGKHFSPA